MTATPPYRVALIGCGRAGLPRARAFDMHPQCRVVALADTDAENLEFARAAFDAPGYDSYDELFANEQIDIVAAVLPVAEGEPLPLLLYGTILAFSVVGSVFATVMFVAQMAFFARVADPAIGGTYMTRAPRPLFFWHLTS